MTCLYEKVDAEYMPGAFKQGFVFFFSPIESIWSKEKNNFQVKLNRKKTDLQNSSTFVYK